MFTSKSLLKKLALYQYFSDWCSPKRVLGVATGQAHLLVAEFQALSTGEYETTYTHLDSHAMFPEKWKISKDVADQYMQHMTIHPMCNVALSAKLTFLGEDDLEAAADSFLRACYKDVFNYYAKLYRLANLILTDCPVYGSCYYLYVIGFYAKRHGNNFLFKHLAKQYLERNILVEDFYQTMTKNSTRFKWCATRAWNLLIDYTQRNDSSIDNLHFIKFIYNHIDFQFNFMAATTVSERNKQLCVAMFGCEEELKHEVEYHLLQAIQE